MNIELDIVDRINDSLQMIIKKLAILEQEKIESTKYEHRSPEIKDLFASLSKAQGAMNAVPLNKTNPYFYMKYSDLRHMIRETRGPLTDNGLSVIQQLISNEDGQQVLHTILTHESGQWIESTVRILPAKNDIKTVESYTNFMKRLAYGSLVGIISEGEDDDGEIEMSQSRETVAKGPSNKYDPKKESFESITKEQLEELEYELSEYPDVGEAVLDGLRILSLADMPKSQFMPSLRKIREITQLRNGLKR